MLTVTDSTIAANSASTSGGGIGDYGALTLINATVAYNTVPSGGTGGGPDVNAGTATVNNAIVALNTGSDSNGYCSENPGRDSAMGATPPPSPHWPG